MRRRIRVMADYRSFPLWETDGTSPANLDPGELPIGSLLRREFSDWQQIYDATLDEHDPLNSGFATAEAYGSFEHEGVRLARELARELGSNWEVIYSPSSTRIIGE